MITKHKNIKKIGLILSCALLANFALAGFAGVGRVWAREVRVDGPATSGTSDTSRGAPSTAILPDNWGIEGILNMILTVVTGGVGLAATISIVFAGVIYTTAAGDASKVGKAKTMILNTVIGLLFYSVMWAFLQWLIPGGVF